MKSKPTHGAQAPEYPGISMPPVKPAKATPTEFITIPVAEYMYLHRLDALMDVLLLDVTYCSANTIQAVKDTILSMRMANKAEAGAEA